MASRRPPQRPGRSMSDLAAAAARTLDDINNWRSGNYDPFQEARQEAAERARLGLEPVDRLIPPHEQDDPQDTGWIPVGSTRVKEIRYLPDTNRLFVRFHKYDTAYVYRTVTDPTFVQTVQLGQAGSGLGGYINDILDNFPRDYCSPEEIDKYFGGYGGTYRGPGTM